MAKRNGPSKPPNVRPEPASGISRITVAGFKSLRDEQSIEVRPLTLLAGANSSGKSSIMQPLLLLKQTLEASYDPGPLLLDGPNVRFTSSDQILSRGIRGLSSFSIGLRSGSASTVRLDFVKPLRGSIDVGAAEYSSGAHKLALRPGGDHETIVRQLSQVPKIDLYADSLGSQYRVLRDKCFLVPSLFYRSTNLGEPISYSVSGLSPEPHAKSLRAMIHLPGLRGNPKRTYGVSAVGTSFPGTFEHYTASVIAHWQAEDEAERLGSLATQLVKLGLTWTVVADAVNETQVELRVGRTPKPSRGRRKDLVSISDVGLGVSQTLPVLVALLVANPGQLVYLEQPEIHLHPRAQTALAQVIADAAKRGVRVVVETHSELLLLGIQTLVAEGSLSPDLVKLHWFQRGDDGFTKIISADLDENGAFGDWPEDFADVALHAQERYLNAARTPTRRP